MARGSDLPVRTKRLLNKVGGWRRTEDGEKGAKRKDGQSRQNVREDPPPAFNPHPENKKKKEKKKRRRREVEETMYTARNPVFTLESRSDVGWVTRRNNG